MAISLGSKGAKFPGMIGTFYRVPRVRNMDEIFFDDRGPLSGGPWPPRTRHRRVKFPQRRTREITVFLGVPVSGRRNGHDRAVNAPDKRNYELSGYTGALAAQPKADRTSLTSSQSVTSRDRHVGYPLIYLPEGATVKATPSNGPRNRTESRLPAIPKSSFLRAWNSSS